MGYFEQYFPHLQDMVNKPIDFLFWKWCFKLKYIAASLLGIGWETVDEVELSCHKMMILYQWSYELRVK